MDAPLPLPLADPLASSLAAVVPASPVASAPASDAAVAEGFAMLLELARLSLDAGAQPEETRHGDTPDTDAEGVAGEPSPAPLDALLFLADTGVLAPVASAAQPASSVLPPGTKAMHAATVTVTGPAVPAVTGSKLESAPAPDADTAPTLPASMALVAAMPRTDAKATATGEAPQSTLSAAPALRAEVDESLAAAVTDEDASTAPPPATLATPKVATAPATNVDIAPVTFPTTPAPSSLSATSVVVTLETPVTHAAWREEAAERIVSLVTRGTERAELKVSPPELGPVDVRIEVKGGEATLTIVAAHPTTRDALENALPQLRELLAQQGLTLGEATVRDGRGDSDRAAADGRGTPSGDGTRGSGEAAPAPGARATLSRRLVDVFA